jgi:penicillin amidase
MGRYDITTAQGMFNDLFWLNDSSAPAVTELAPSVTQPLDGELSHASLVGVEGATAEFDQLVKEALETTEKLGVGTTLGSYGWVVSGDKTDTGYPILYGGPQFGWRTPSTIHVAHLKDGKGLNVVGISFPGFPGNIIGYNENVAWSQMVGMGDVVDTYVETLNPFNHEQYLYNGEYLDMDKRVETINVARGEPINITIYRTIHGPVVSPFPFDPSDSEVSQVYAQKSAHWMLEPKSIDGVWKMMQATNVSQFEEGIQEVYMPLHCIYADREGNIAYWHVGLLPVRPDGFDPRLPLPGTGEAEWAGFRTQPKALNPEKGYLAAWNNKASPDLDNPDGPETWRFGKFHRVRWIYSFLEAKPTVTLEDIKELALVIGSVGLTEPAWPSAHGFGYNIGEFLPRLVQMVEEVSITDPYHAQLNEAVSILSAWDGRSVEDTVASTTITVAQTIFDAWVSFMIRNTFEDEFEGIYAFDSPNIANFNMLLHALNGPYSAVPPTRDYFDDVSTTNEVEAVHTIVLKSMKQAIDKLSAQFETGEMTQWVAERPVITFTHQMLGPVSTVPRANRSTYSQVIELKPEGIEGSIHLALGNSDGIFQDAQGWPVFDTHFLDMQPLYIGYEYWPVPLDAD